MELPERTPMGKVEDAAQEWSDKYSRDGEFEESGQREAFHAGWNKALESISTTDLISEKYRLREKVKHCDEIKAKLNFAIDSCQRHSLEVEKLETAVREILWSCENDLGREVHEIAERCLNWIKRYRETGCQERVLTYDELQKVTRQS